MRKDRISVALAQDLIAKLNEASRMARRSRSDYVQIALEEHFARYEEKREKELVMPRKYAPRPMVRS